MIPVLFKANAVDFSTYGIGVLADCISCEVTEERNGAYELVLQYPVTGRNYGELSSERIIKAKPNDTADDQAFRIYRITTPYRWRGNGVCSAHLLRPLQYRRPDLVQREHFAGACHATCLSEHRHRPQLHLSDGLLRGKALLRGQSPRASVLVWAA